MQMQNIKYDFKAGQVFTGPNGIIKIIKVEEGKSITEDSIHLLHVFNGTETKDYCPNQWLINFIYNYSYIPAAK